MIFENGGLRYWFECDRPGYGLATVAALHALELSTAATKLGEAYALFPDTEDYHDFRARNKCSARLAAEFRMLEGAMGKQVGAICDAGGRYVRKHRDAFEALRTRPPYDSRSDRYGEA